MLRERGLGNSTTQLRKKVAEQIGEEHLNRVLRYLSDCSMRSAAFDAFRRQRAFLPPPPQPVVPSARWLLRAYVQDALTRQEQNLAAITSVWPGAQDGLHPQGMYYITSTFNRTD